MRKLSSIIPKSASFLCLFTVPASSTSSVSTTASAKSINVTVTLPGLLQQNGIITRYSVAFYSLPTNKTTLFFNVSGPQNGTHVFKLSGLEESQNYSIVISACNSAGCSQNTTNTSATTLSAGKALQLSWY